MANLIGGLCRKILLVMGIQVPLSRKVESYLVGRAYARALTDAWKMQELVDSLRHDTVILEVLHEMLHKESNLSFDPELVSWPLK